MGNKNFVMIGKTLVNMDQVVSFTPGIRYSDAVAEDEMFVRVSFVNGKSIEVSSMAFPRHYDAVMSFIEQAPSFIDIMERKQKEAALHAGPEYKGGK